MALARQYQDMSAEVAKSAPTGEDALLLKKYIQNATIQQERMKEQIARNKAKESFLVGYRYPIPEDDMHVGLACYEWPRKMGDIMKEAAFKANTEHKSFEAALKAQRVEFAARLTEFQKEMEGYDKKNDVVKRDQIAAEVTALAEKLAEAAREAEYINSQEKLFAWSLTKYGQVTKMISQLDPYVTLWTCVAGFSASAVTSAAIWSRFTTSFFLS